MSKKVSREERVARIREEMAGVQRTELKYSEYWALKYVTAAVSSMAHLDDRMMERIGRIPHGRMYLKTACGLMDKLLSLIYCTIPKEKLPRLAQDLKLTEIYIKNKGAARYDNDEHDYVNLTRVEISKLVELACRSECTLCDKCGKAIRKCELRQLVAGTFNHEVPVEMDGQCFFSRYTTSDMRRIMETGEWDEEKDSV